MPIPTRMNARKSRLPNDGRATTGNCAVISTINFPTSYDGIGELLPDCVLAASCSSGQVERCIEVECCVMARCSIRVVVSARAALLITLSLCAASVSFAQSSRGGAAPSSAAAASHSAFPSEARESLDALYRGNTEAAIVIARRMEISRPEYPLGYLLEAEAHWWRIYCGALEFKWNHIDLWKHDPSAGDDAYLALADKVAELAENQLRAKETAEMHLYAGMGYVLRVRMLGIRKENRATAKGAVKARTHLMRALEMDPSLADAKTGLGLYNYYVDTLTGIARMLRAIMGLPAGDKKLGVQQMEDAMVHGELTGVDARFYLSKNLRYYDQEYERALKVMEPLAVQYPQNPIFPLFIGNLNALLGRNERAAASYRAAEKLAGALPGTESASKARLDALVKEGLGMVGGR
jgi:tetratricopeptide (TPR) repeat protein